MFLHSKSLSLMVSISIGFELSLLELEVPKWRESIDAFKESMLFAMFSICAGIDVKSALTKANILFSSLDELSEGKFS